MKRILFLLGVLLAGVALARADITFRISVKAVLNPATGNRQSGVSDVTFSNTVAGMNEMSAPSPEARSYSSTGCWATRRPPPCCTRLATTSISRTRSTGGRI